MNSPFQLGIANGVEQFSVFRTRANSKLFEVVTGNERRRVELGSGKCQLLAAEVDLGRRAVEDAGDGFTVAEQFFDAGGNEHALQLRPGLLAGGANERLLAEQLFNADELVRGELPPFE